MLFRFGPEIMGGAGDLHAKFKNVIAVDNPTKDAEVEKVAVTKPPDYLFTSLKSVRSIAGWLESFSTYLDYLRCMTMSISLNAYVLRSLLNFNWTHIVALAYLPRDYCLRFRIYP